MLQFEMPKCINPSNNIKNMAVATGCCRKNERVLVFVGVSGCIGRANGAR